jgi:hypothetical protein
MLPSVSKGGYGSGDTCNKLLAYQLVSLGLL